MPKRPSRKRWRPAAARGPRQMCRPAGRGDCTTSLESGAAAATAPGGGALDAGDPRVLVRLHAAAILRDAVRAALVTALGLALAQLARAYLPGAITVRSVVLLNVAAVGAALAAGTAGTLRLVGRGAPLRWFD